MCECFSLLAETEELSEVFRIDQVLNGSPGKDMLKPTEDIPVITSMNGNRCLDRYIWGIFPFWGKDSVNARSETIRERHAFKRNFVKQRCIVPCDGFYVRVPLGKKKTRLIRVSLNGRRFFGLAALYDVWMSPGGSEYRTCTIMTTSAGEPVSSYNSRMPVILDEEGMELWLSAPSHSDRRLDGLMQPYRGGGISIHI